MAIISRIKQKALEIRKNMGLISLKGNHWGKIIMYHGVDSIENRRFNSRHFGVKNFEKQLAFFKRNFDIVSIPDFFNQKAPAWSKRMKLAITFDDGLANNYRYAFPVLEKLQVPATFYVTGLNNCERPIIWPDLYDIYNALSDAPFYLEKTQFTKKKGERHFKNPNGVTFYEVFKSDSRAMQIKQEEIWQQFTRQISDFRNKKELSDYWELMTDENIREVARSKFVTIGSHGYYHNCLGKIRSEEAIAEIQASKSYLENLTQTAINTIAYPDGSYTRELVEAAAKMGFDYQLVVDYLFKEDHDDNRVLNRMGLYPLEIPENEKKIAYQIAYGPI